MNDSIDSNSPTATRKAAETADQISGTIERGSDNTVGYMARGISESAEHLDSREPANSMIRTVLLSGAGLAIATSLVMQMSGRKHESLFFGQWVPTLVAVALWYQMIKGQQGQTSRARPPSDVIV